MINWLACVWDIPSRELHSLSNIAANIFTSTDVLFFFNYHDVMKDVRTCLRFLLFYVYHVLTLMSADILRSTRISYYLNLLL